MVNDTRISAVLHIDMRAVTTVETVDHEGVVWRDEVTRQALRQLANAPDGAAAIVHVDPDTPRPSFHGADDRDQHIGHLSSVAVHCSHAPTITEWVTALQGGGR